MLVRNGMNGRAPEFSALLIPIGNHDETGPESSRSLYHHGGTESTEAGQGFYLRVLRA